MWHLRSDMSIAYDVVHVLVNVFAPNRLGVHSLTRPAQECLRGRTISLLFLPLYDERSNFSLYCYCIGTLLFQHILSPRPNDSHFHTHLLSIWRGSKRMKRRTRHTCTQANFLHFFHKNKFPIFTYTRAQRQVWRLVCGEGVRASFSVPAE